MKLDELTNKIIKFRDERDWKQFHNPKDLAISLSIEAAELLERFQWKSNEEVEVLLKNSDKKKKVAEEIADVGNYLLLLCHELDIDLFQAIDEKLKENDEKYPVEKSKGNSNKYNEL